MSGLKFKVKALTQRHTFKTILKYTFISLLFVIVLLFSVDAYLTHKATPYLYNDVNKIPFNKVGLLPGTSKKLKNGKENLYYTYKINAAVKL
jgi:SanA protein